MGKQEIVIRFPTGQGTSLQSVQSCSGAHPASCSMDNAVTLSSMHEASFQCRRTPHMPSWPTRRLLLLPLVFCIGKRGEALPYFFNRFFVIFHIFFGLFVQLVSVISQPVQSVCFCTHKCITEKLITTHI